MVISHFTALVIFAICVSMVFALSSKETTRDRLRYGIFVFVIFLVVSLGLGWLMAPFPR
ncbi:MAG: hypothetical protein OXI92_14915 [Acidobacteriota bacterium]|nr:hypothetical protein [Acidobacteriota bacterium]